jgi:hypothetical protein
MKLLGLSAGLILAISGVAAAGQSAGTAARGSGSPASTPSLTLIGCVQSADPAGAPSGAAGGSASSGSTSDPSTVQPNASAFVLANVTLPPPSSASPGKSEVAATGGSAAVESANSRNAAPLTFGLEGDDVARYINQQVEVTGTLPDQASALTGPPAQSEGSASGAFGSGSSSTAAPANAGAPRAGSAAAAKGALPKLRVQSVRVIASTCGQP